MVRTVAAFSKTSQLQIRVSAADKIAIQRAARSAGMDMSAYVLERVLGVHDRRVAALMQQLKRDSTRRFALAELHDILASLTAGELVRAVASPPPAQLPAETANYVAAMIEYTCAQRGVDAPVWTRSIAPLVTPMFGSQLQSLRLHLLSKSPPPFRRRNIFIDTSIGGRV